MRLLNTTTLRLHEFFEAQIPPYVILSHRWEGAEVTFQDMKDEEAIKSMQGYKKIEGCCRQARKDGFEFAWIDSCCIDKSSSAELSEAINSMFRWYQKAQVCYAYLSDVSTVNYYDNYQVDSEFRRSLWFTRGWTLQELLAPEIVVFYNRDWIEIGTRRDANELISSITAIAAKILRSPFSPNSESVAKTMSWASKRTTTRLEDTAYCLMGLFDVNMPLLYGEGSKAFYRLQLEIIKSSTDQSIFAWESEGPDAYPLGQGPWTLPLFATEPAMFQHAGNIECSHFGVKFISPYTMTNRGLQIQAKLVPALVFTKATKSEKLLPLTFCYRKIDSTKINLAVFLHQVVSGTFVRIRKQLFEIDEERNPSFTKETSKKETQIYIVHGAPRIDSGMNETVTSVSLDLRSALQAGFIITKTQFEEWSNGDHNIIPETWEGDFWIIRFPDSQTLHVNFIKPEEWFRITLSTSERPLELSVKTYQREGTEAKSLKLFSDSHLPSGQVVRTVIKKRMLDGEPIWAVEVLINTVK